MVINIIKSIGLRHTIELDRRKVDVSEIRDAFITAMLVDGYTQDIIDDIFPPSGLNSLEFNKDNSPSPASAS